MKLVLAFPALILLTATALQDGGPIPPPDGAPPSELSRPNFSIATPATGTPSVSARGDYGCGVTTVGTAYCSGSNAIVRGRFRTIGGRLGNGRNTLDSPVPVAVAGGLTFQSVSAGKTHSCGVTTAGKAYCWGRSADSSFGILGIDSPSVVVPLNMPVAVAGGLTFQSVSAGYSHTCGVTTAGKAYCWSPRGGRPLANGEYAATTAPVAVAPGLTFQSVSVGGFYSCGVTTAGAAYCSVDNERYTDNRVPVAVPGGLTFQSVSASLQYVCGVTTTGKAYCWAKNGAHPLGKPGIYSSVMPVAVAGGLTFQSVSAGEAHSCGVTSAGAAYCWGSNGEGELGDGTNTHSPVPVAVAGGLTFQSVSAGARHSCGVTTAGAAYCWGTNLYDELGNGTEPMDAATMNSRVPVPVAGGLTFQSVSAGVYHNCGVTTAGAAYCWGTSSLGDGRTAVSNVPVAVAGAFALAGPIPPPDGAPHTELTGPNSSMARPVSGSASVSVGYRHTCGVTTAGQAYCWGANGSGQLGDGTGGVPTSEGQRAHIDVPVAVAGGLTFQSVSAGNPLYSCGVTTAGRVHCWGHQYGNVPVVVPGGFTFQSVSTGFQHVCGVTTAGKAYCWATGKDITNKSNVPVAVAGGLTFQSVSAGVYHNCGVTAVGAAYCWGSNTFGELGNGTATGSNVPVAVAGGLTFQSVSAGTSHSCGVTTAGAAYCWGSNGYFLRGPADGELGNGTNVASNVPVAVAGGLTFQSVSAGNHYSCGVTTAGTAYCWGNGEFAALGNGTYVDSNVPMAVAGRLTFQSVSAGTTHTCGVTMAGAAYCWGGSEFGALGNGGIPGSVMPMAVAGGLTF